MSRKKKLQVSPTELDVLQVLWEGGPMTLRDVHERLADRHAYVTVHTMLNRLVEKGEVARDGKRRPARFKAKVTRDRVVRHYLGLMLEKVCDSPTPLVLRLLKDESFSAQDLAAIQSLIDQMRPSSQGESDVQS